MWRLGMLAFALAGCTQIFGLDVPTVMPAGDAGPTAVTIGGQVRGLSAASGLVLQNNGGDDKPIVSDGDYVFPTAIPVGSPYDVTVAVQPTNPSEICVVMNGSGTATDFNFGGAIVQCAPATYTIGGTVQGLSGPVMLHNGSDTLTITSNGAFTFPTPVLSGQMYAVTASGNGACAVFGGTGSVGDGDVTSVLVNCSSSAGPYAIGGHVSGLNGTVKLRNSSNNDTVTISSNGTYAFAMLVPSAGSYNVTVTQQPAYPPASQTCTVTNGTGTAGGNVQNVDVTCMTKSFIVGGSVTQLNGTVVLQNNGADDVSQTGTGSFAFATPVASGGPYNVTVKTAPAGETCTVSGGVGTVSNANVTNVMVSCTDPGTKCGSTFCTGTQGCCNPTGTATCKAKANCTSTWMQCDDAADCSAGFVCCATISSDGLSVTATTCASSCNGNSQKRMCDPNLSGQCPAGVTCKPAPILPGYYYCF